MTVTIDGATGITTPDLTGNITGNLTGAVTGSVNGITPQASNMQPHNLIINGAMTVAQRGTSVVGKTGASYQTCDRWLTNASGSTYNQSQEIVPLGDSIVGQFKYFLRHEVTTGANNAGLIYRIEGVQSVPEGTVTLSFYAKGTNPNSGELDINVFQRFGTGGTPSAEVTSLASNITLTTSWQRFTIQITVPSLSGKTLGTNNDNYYMIQFFQPNGDASTDAWTLDITGVQLEVGSTASSFAHEDYSDTLRKCQRYFEIGQSKVWVGGATASGIAVYVPHKVTKRADPSIVVTSGSYTPTTIEASTIHGHTAYKESTREIQYYFTASAEL